MVTVLELRQNSVDIDPDWYAGQPETAEEAPAGEAEAAPTISVPTVLTKLQKWGDYESWGEPVWPSRFIPMKTPLSQEILDNWQLSNPPKHSLTVGDVLAAQTAAGRHVGLILDLSNHDCLYSSDVPPSVDYLHVQLVAKELPPLEFVQEVGRAANQYWSLHGDSYTAIHCAYGFNRTGFVVCSYLIEHCGLSVEQALQSFARSRPPGVKHEKFKNELHARYGVSNMHIQRPISSCGPMCAACGQASLQINSSSESASNSQVSSSTRVQDSRASSTCSAQSNCCSRRGCQQPGPSAGTLSKAPAALEQPARASSSNSHSNSATTTSGSSHRQSNSCQKPPLDPQLAQLISSNSIDAHSLPRIPDATSSPLPVMSGRCYSSGSMGDNSSIGCSPDSTADVLLTGSTHSSASPGYAAARMAAVQQQQQQAGLAPGMHWLGRRAGLQGSSLQSSQASNASGRSIGTAASPCAEPAAAAARVDAVSLPELCCNSQMPSNDAECNDAEVFDLDPCGEERVVGCSWQANDAAARGDTNGWCRDAVGYQEQRLQQQQQQQQEAPAAQQLSDLMAAVGLGQHQQRRLVQQQQQSSHNHRDAALNADQQQQYEAAGGDSCDCSCHAAAASNIDRDSGDGGVAQTRLRYSLLSSDDGRGPAGPHELLDNESFGRVSSTDMLKNLRSLQQPPHAN